MNKSTIGRAVCIGVSVLLGQASQAQVVSGTSMSMGGLSMTFNDLNSPYAHSLFTTLTGGPTPTNFNGPSLVDVAVDYSFSADGSGSMTFRTLSNSHLFRLDAQAGAFTVQSSAGGPYPAEVLAAFPVFVMASNPALMSLTRLESPAGTPVADSLFQAGPFTGAGVLFNTDPFAPQTLAVAGALCIRTPNYWVYAAAPTPGSVSILAAGGWLISRRRR